MHQLIALSTHLLQAVVIVCFPCIPFYFNKMLWSFSGSLDDNVLHYAQFCGKALNCLDVGGESSALIAAGGSDTTLRIWDPRKPGF